MNIEQNKIYLINYTDNTGMKSLRLITTNPKYFEKFYSDLSLDKNPKKKSNNNPNLTIFQIASEKSNNLIDTKPSIKTLKEENIKIIDYIDINQNILDNNIDNIYSYFENKQYFEIYELFEEYKLLNKLKENKTELIEAKKKITNLLKNTENELILF